MENLNPVNRLLDPEAPATMADLWDAMADTQRYRLDITFYQPEWLLWAHLALLIVTIAALIAVIVYCAARIGEIANGSSHMDKARHAMVHGRMVQPMEGPVHGGRLIPPPADAHAAPGAGRRVPGRGHGRPSGEDAGGKAAQHRR